MERIKAYFLRCNEKEQFRGYIAEVDNSLETEQKYVGGLIDVIALTPEIDCIFNDNGKLENLPINRVIRDTDSGEIRDFIVGNIMCVRHQDGAFISIHEEDIPVIEKILVPCKGITFVNGNTVFVTYPSKFCSEWKEEQDGDVKK